jgi:hypothetical protein
MGSDILLVSLSLALQVTRVCSQADFEAGGLNLTATVTGQTLTGTHELLQLIAVSAVNLTQVRSMNVSVGAGNVTRLERAGEHHQVGLLVRSASRCIEVVLPALHDEGREMTVETALVNMLTCCLA